MNKARIVFCYLIVKGTNHKSIPNFEPFFNENGMPIVVELNLQKCLSDSTGQLESLASSLIAQGSSNFGAVGNPRSM